MRPRWKKLATAAFAGVAACVVAASPVRAQETVEGTPSFKVGATIFADYTYTDEPTAVDDNGKTYHPSSFNVGRTYINVTGQLSDVISFRITPDISKQGQSGDSLNGSYVFRLKYGFLQWDLGKALESKGSWVRFGQSQTPWIDYDEGIYRYRFQGPTFADTEGFLSSSDLGISGHYNFPGDYGDVQLGYFNGEGYGHTEINNQKSFQLRASLRPAPGVDGVKGLRVNGFFDTDHYVSSDKRQRFLVGATYQSTYVNAGGYYLDAKDQKTNASAEVHAKGYTVWVTPRTTFGLEGLFRYDSLKPNDTIDGRKKRTIVGVAYWFPTFKGVQSAVMLDYTRVKFDSALPGTNSKAWAVHTLINF
jgi:hypothetical protein